MKNMDRATALVFAWPSIEQDSGITIMFQRPKHGSAHLTLLAAVLCACSLAVQASPTSQEAEEIRSLPSGHWLVLEEDALHLLAPGGRETDQLALRGEGLDARLDGATAMAVVTDRDSREVIPVSVNLQDGRLTRLAALDTGPLTPEAACLFRDEQGLLHAVVLGQEGFAQQWILHEGTARLLRQLTMPPGAERCQVDDHTATLFLLEPAVGLWAYGVTQDAPMERALVARSIPHGPLQPDAEVLAVGPAWVAVLSEDGRQARMWTQQGKAGWSASAAVALPGPADALASAQDGRVQRLWWRDASTARWAGLPLKGPVAAARKERVPFVFAAAQTAPVASRGDAADDPALWVHPDRPQDSRVVGTNKKLGLEVYALDGRLVQSLPTGRMNNVDVRQGVQWGNTSGDIAAASNRSDNTITVWKIDRDGALSEWGRIPTGLNEVYGICLYQPAEGGAHVFINDKDGRFRQFELTAPQGVLQGRLLREFAVASQPEGCVVDDAQARIFMGEEDQGVWVMSARAEQPARPQLVAEVGRHLTADVEGLGLYHGKQQSYLVVSSQGDNSFVLFQANAPYRFVGKVRVGINASQGIDGVAETDGLEVTSASLGAGIFSQGALVVQDGYKRLPDGNQNFKLVPWADVVRALALPE